MLTERAALAGAVARITSDRLPLEAELEKLESQARQKRDHLAGMQSALLKHQAQLEAIELVLKHTYPGVDPASVGAVAAWAGKYGRRGELTAFIHSTIKAAHPEGVPTQQLMEAIMSRFSLGATKEDFLRFRHVVLKRLSLAKAAGLMQSRPGKKRSSSVWFWNAGPSGAQLQALAATAGDHDDSAQPNAPRGQVGGQRAGLSHG